jgi:hypothetical protein
LIAIWIPNPVLAVIPDEPRGGEIRNPLGVEALAGLCPPTDISVSRLLSLRALAGMTDMT